MKHSLLVLLGLLAATALVVIPSSQASSSVVATPLAFHVEGGATSNAGAWLDPDPYFGASDFQAVQTETCNRCRAHPPCGSAGAKCGKEQGGPCFCRTCNGLFDCWQGK
jgi:hypothetical protein